MADMRTVERPMWPRNPGAGRNDFPRSVTVFAPAELSPSSETPTRWTPYGTFVPRPYFGGHDGLDGQLMHVPQADLYNSDPCPWPANGVNDHPNAAFHLIRLQPSTSAHPGASLAGSGGGPAMVFHTPPVWGQQTTPIWAVGV